MKAGPCLAVEAISLDAWSGAEEGEDGEHAAMLIR
jgi:hypothetical protein